MLLVIKCISLSSLWDRAHSYHIQGDRRLLDNDSASQHVKATSAHFIWLLLVLADAKGRDPEQREFYQGKWFHITQP